MASTETRKMVLAAAAACEEKKAENTRVLELDPQAADAAAVRAQLAKLAKARASLN